MKEYELFNLIKKTKFLTCGDDVSFQILKREEEKKILLLFEETRSKTDWKTNFKFPKKPYKNQERHLVLHGGYISAWKSARDIITMLFINEINNNPEYSLLIAGWSYGAAMALIAAEDFNYMTSRKAEVITFGAPKICADKKTAETINQACLSVRQYDNVNDLVTKVVPWFYPVNRINVDKDFNLKKLFNPKVYHCKYGEKEIYNL